MTAKTLVRASDLRGYGRLAIDATIGLTRVVETMHHNVLRAPGVFGAPTREPARGITGLVYRSIRGVTRLVGGGIDTLLAQVSSAFGQASSSMERETLLAALNGVLGDHLAASGNPLAIRMAWRRDGVPLELTPHALAAAIPNPTGKVLLLVHGLCMNDLQWRRKGHDHGAALAADAGFTPLYLHYNSGLHVSTNGRAFADRIEQLLQAWPVPVEQVAIIGHSMGGLLARSACHYGKLAGHGWLRHLRTIVFLGTPHHGAPLERRGNWFDNLLDSSPYTVAFARLGKIRSAGITDLRHGSLLDEDWQDRDRFAPGHDQRLPVAWPRGVKCHAIAASVATRTGTIERPLPGDGLVPVDSALGLDARRDGKPGIPQSRQWIGYGMHHLDLLDRHEVHEQIRLWLIGENRSE
jgi:pimeloyl-ACP methyl ester carboxylesterase